MSVGKTTQDPHFEREAQKYDKPIASREWIMAKLDQAQGPLSFEELAEAFQLTSPDDLEALYRRLKAMVRDAQLMRLRNRKFGLVTKMDLVKGVVEAQREGIGFVITDALDQDIFIPPNQMRMVLDGDTVLVRVLEEKSRTRRPEGVIVEILERKHQTIVGRFYEQEGLGYVVPDNAQIQQEIFIPKEGIRDAQEGDIVVVQLNTPLLPAKHFVGEVIEVLGDAMAPGMETDIAIRAFHLPHLWPEDALKEADAFPDKISSKDLKNRLDLRHLPFVTIDGEDAQDFDDAVYCEPKKSGGFKLFVAIADVSHYVTPNSALEKEAFDRGNSVYFANRVIPMLPEALSNGLCSLNPKVDRLTVTCEMDITASGRISQYEFHRTVIHSQARMTYDDVAAILEGGDKPLCQKYHALLAQFFALHELYLVLKKAREEKGALFFELPEAKVIFTDQEKIEAIIERKRNIAHMLIEECMLVANVCAAKYFKKHHFPGLYRSHPGPKAEALPDLVKYLAAFGLKFKGGDQPTPKDYAVLMTSLQGRPDAHSIQMALLRSLSQAYYSVKNEGHFGLSFDFYTHFTSPIRRFPDLLVHRSILKIIDQKKADKAHVELLEKAAGHCSYTERRADEATRDALSWLKCEFMLDKLGQNFKGVVAAVKHFGLFVQLTDFFVEGLLHISALDNDYYHYDAERQQLVGERSGRIYRVGAPIEIQVARVSLQEKQIDFILAPSEAPPKPKSKTKKKK